MRTLQLLLIAYLGLTLKLHRKAINTTRELCVPELLGDLLQYSYQHVLKYLANKIQKRQIQLKKAAKQINLLLQYRGEMERYL